MCLNIYLPTDRRLAPIPWDSERPGLRIGELSTNEEPVRSQVSRPLVYYVGCHTQCGCGFVEHDADAEQSRVLAFYIDALGPLTPAELFVCWDGRYREDSPTFDRSEERRVGKECRSRWS